MFNPIIALALVTSSPAPAAQASQAAPSLTPHERELACFMMAVSLSQRLTKDPDIPADRRRMEPLLRATANFFAGRISTRLSGEPLRQILLTAPALFRRANSPQFIEGCPADFTGFMQVVGNVDGEP